MKKFLAGLILALPSLCLGAGVVGIFPWGITSPTDGQVLKYVAADGKWENGTGGGSGTVTHNGNLLTGYIALGGTNGTTDITSSNVTIDGSGNIVTPGNLTVATLIPTSITWGSSLIPAANGGTNLNTSSSTGVPQISGGTWSVSTTLPSGLSATNLTLVTPALGTPASGTLTNCTGLPSSGLLAGAGTHAVTFTFNGNGTALTTATSIPICVPYGGTVIGYTCTCSPAAASNNTINIFRSTGTTTLPTASIINSAGGGGGSGTLPTLAASAVAVNSTTLTSWGSTAIAANDVIAANLTTADGTITEATITLYYK